MPYKNKEDLIANKKRYYLNNKKRILIYGKKRYQENRTIFALKAKENYWKNPELHREYSQRYRQEHPEHLPEYQKIYRKTENGKIIRERADIKRRTGIKNNNNTLTSKEWLDILEAHNYRCAYCDIEFEVENMPTKDHVIPLSKGGHNTKENVVPSCRSCNSKKHNNILVGEING